jgi:hypothetical protein
MLSRVAVRSWVPRIRMTAFNGVGVIQVGVPAQLPRAHPLPLPRPTLSRPTPPPPAAPPVMQDPADKVMPTPFVDAEQQQSKDCGTGQPAQRGRRKPLVWKRRTMWFDRQWTLDMKRVYKAPATPTFPNGTPFKQIRGLRSFAGRGFKINSGRRRKHRMSLKRGRRKLL